MNNPTIDGLSRKALEQALLAMKRIYQAGYDQIIEAGGQCDTPEYMMAGDPTARELRALLDAPALARQDPVAIPDGYCIMPKRLTAENGAKALLLGEFKVEVTNECPDCGELDEPNEHCEICDGEGEYSQRHTISWDQIKFIYSKAVEGLRLKPHQGISGQEGLTFKYRDPASSEVRIVGLTKAEVEEGMQDTLHEKLTAQLCQCEPVGETNVADCNCNDYAAEFERVADQAGQRPPVTVILPDRKGPHEYRDASYTQTCMANEWNACIDAITYRWG
ncbi:hypothetical protein C1893_23260 [Pseudomonas sp. MPR-ANC1]|uniref:hypothetical protein n=1 Tax=Pseudomonas sp. MPR-ANC1 TaxID=2075548 RepID=UPI000CD21A48|nr:hypothetical protein [Pseudomonas sp. MPR-ANC1]POA45577.1 hypothetical protein C1893_23260 [Pseudomonas sp. MPR-ANC1]